MTLHEKILYYRKQARLSQEELAARVGVSRQAVSKWELGESSPEVGKLLTLSRIFGVTADQLLSEEDPAPPPPPPPEPPREEAGTSASASDSRRFRLLGRMIQRWGWLAGVWLALQGAGVALVGAFGRYAFGQMFRSASSLMGGWGGLPGSLGTGWETGLDAAPAGVFGMEAVFLNITTAVLVLGIGMILVGIALAVFLKLRDKR